ncbi:MAG: hypothetical protein ACYDCL_22540 [Myxococcales bacterium]
MAKARKVTPAHKASTMSVVEAGRKGGERVLQERGPEFFSKIGKKGGQRVRELINAGRRAELA